MAKKKKKDAMPIWDGIRKPTAPPSQKHDTSKKRKENPRKRKHKGKDEGDE